MVALAALTAALLVLTGCSDAEPISSSATSPPRPTSTTEPTTSEPAEEPETVAVTGIPDDWTPAPLAWGACEDPAITECTTLAVPLDWSDVQGPTIDLALGRQRALREPIGPLMMNPGGPGASGLEFLSYSLVSSEVRDRFDLVSWDPRGVGASTAVSCGAGSAELFAQRPLTRRRRRDRRPRAGGRRAVERVRRRPGPARTDRHLERRP